MLKRFLLCSSNGDKVRNGPDFSEIEGSLDPHANNQYQEDIISGDQQDSAAKPTSKHLKRSTVASKNDVYSFNYALTLKNKEIAELKMKVVNFDEILREKERLELKVQELQFTLEQKDDLIRKLKSNSTSSKWPIYSMWFLIPKKIIINQRPYPQIACKQLTSFISNTHLYVKC